MPHSCRVYTAFNPASQWGWSEILANKTNYFLETLIWMKTKDAQKKPYKNKPTIFVPDFMKRSSDKSPINKDSEAHTTDDIKSILALPRN